jgi:diaminopimelate decarboxylase
MLAKSDGELVAALGSIRPDPALRRRYLLPGVLEANFAALRNLAASLPPLAFAYSIKTNPRDEVLEAARRFGIFAEAISTGELEAARRCGFDRAAMVYNGPVPAWRSPIAPGVAFADSVEAYRKNAASLEQTLCGARLRPGSVDSRFGIPESQTPALIEAIRAAGRGEIAFSFHVRPQDFGGAGWREIVERVLERAVAVTRATGARPRAFDVGGGWEPKTFDAAVERGDFAWLVETVACALPEVETVLAEPGQAVVAHAEILVAPILEVRSGLTAREAIVDAGFPDAPQIRSYPHRFFALDAGGATRLREGPDRIAGSTCLEYDVFAESVALPTDLSATSVAIADVGAYDSSMSFAFGKGAEWNTA